MIIKILISIAFLVISSILFQIVYDKTITLMVNRINAVDKKNGLPGNLTEDDYGSKWGFRFYVISTIGSIIYNANKFPELRPWPFFKSLILYTIAFYLIYLILITFKNKFRRLSNRFNGLKNMFDKDK